MGIYEIFWELESVGVGAILKRWWREGDKDGIRFIAGETGCIVVPLLRWKHKGTSGL